MFCFMPSGTSLPCCCSSFPKWHSRVAYAFSISLSLSFSLLYFFVYVSHTWSLVSITSFLMVLGWGIFVPGNITMKQWVTVMRLYRTLTIYFFITLLVPWSVTNKELKLLTLILQIMCWKEVMGHLLLVIIFFLKFLVSFVFSIPYGCLILILYFSLTGGFYYGKIKFPPEYPYKPPGITYVL